MANENDSGQPARQEANELAGLKERVSRLEVELAAMRRQMAGQSAIEAVVVTASVATPVAPPPPPRPAMSEEESERSARKLVSEAWASLPRRDAPVATAENRGSFESQLGSQIFNRIAIVLLLIGTAYGLKMAVDRGWIGPMARVLVGLAAGAGIVVWSERFRLKGFAAFSYGLKAVGTGVLYLSLWGAFQLYHLLPASVALVLMILVTAWNAYMAWAQNSELLAAYALAGGFATPMLLSTGGNHEIFLFTYLLAIDAAIVALVRLRGWPRLLLGAFPLTVGYFIGWYSEFYSVDALLVTSVYIALFGAVFGSVPVGRVTEESGRFLRLGTLLDDILLPLANAAFVALAYYSVLQDAGDHALLPWLMLVLAAVYLAVMQLPQTAVASAMHLSLAVVFLTIAIPLKASGHWITVSWLVEGLALLWVATRLGGENESEAYASGTLRWLSMGSLLLGFGGVFFHIADLFHVSNLPLINKGTGTALTGIAIFATVAWLALRTSAPAAADKERGQIWAGIARAAFVLVALTAAMLTLRELLANSWNWDVVHPPFQSADFFTALIGLAVFGGVIATSKRIADERTGDDFWIGCAAASTIAFNLIAVLTGVREISAIWAGVGPGNEDAGLQQALAISAFLMLYGAGLLAVGFWRRSEFLRWQALVLLVFTICKTFLYDMRNLSQGYRVVSFLGLGAVLMTISFAYQKDWLNLRAPEAKHEPDGEHGPGPGVAR
jgi:uncharacterized membrane protein